MSSGVAADGSPIPTDGWSSMSYNEANNRISVEGWEYDVAGNLVRARGVDGSWIRFEYDAANRLKVVKRDDGTGLQGFQYGSTNARLMDYDYVTGQMRIVFSVGGQDLMEYVEGGGQVRWSKSYVYMGERLLQTVMPNGVGGEQVEYNHPDRLGTRLVTNANGHYEQVVLPFGVGLDNESSGATSRRFTSYERSQRTGLDYAIKRLQR